MTGSYRGWLAAGLIAATLILLPGCGGPHHRPLGRRVIVLGFDGMDYALTRDLMAAGRLPHFAELARRGRFGPLGTSIPPQSPVAWASFITGLDPGGHGIFDFIHRDPGTMTPYLSTTRTVPPGHVLSLGRYRLPLTAGRVELLRRGRAFWEELDARGIDTTIVRMPANFPPSGHAARELSGMGTPDLLGTYGTFSLYTSDPFMTEGPVAGGTIYRVVPKDGRVSGTLEGPDDPLLAEHEKVRTPFVADIDTSRRFAKIVVGSEERLLRVGEWSDWVPVRFALAWGDLHAQCRFYLKALDPDIALYVSPLNLDPFAPALPVSSPASYAADLARATGRFYTQGMPEDTKALWRTTTPISSPPATRRRAWTGCSPKASTRARPSRRPSASSHCPATCRWASWRPITACRSRRVTPRPPRPNCSTSGSTNRPRSAIASPWVPRCWWCAAWTRIASSRWG